MSKEQRTIEVSQKEMNALKDCIVEWRKTVLTGKRGNCALCDLANQCTECLIHRWTNGGDCGDTPWDNYCTAYGSEQPKIALDMLEFLQEIEHAAVVKKSEIQAGDWVFCEGQYGGIRKHKAIETPCSQCRFATPEEIHEHKQAEANKKAAEEKEAKAERHKAEGWGVGIEKDAWVIFENDHPTESPRDLRKVQRVEALGTGHFGRDVIFTNAGSWYPERCRLATQEEINKSENARKDEGWGVGIEVEKWVMWDISSISRPGTKGIILVKVTRIDDSRGVNVEHSIYKRGYLTMMRLATPEEMYKPGARVRYVSTKAHPGRIIEDVIVGISCSKLGVVFANIPKGKLFKSCTLIEPAPESKT